VTCEISVGVDVNSTVDFVVVLASGLTRTTTLTRLESPDAHSDIGANPLCCCLPETAIDRFFPHFQQRIAPMKDGSMPDRLSTLMRRAIPLFSAKDNP
jgi:hypothetical protein